MYLFKIVRAKTLSCATPILSESPTVGRRVALTLCLFCPCRPDWFFFCFRCVCSPGLLWLGESVSVEGLVRRWFLLVGAMAVVLVGLAWRRFLLIGASETVSFHSFGLV